MGVLDKFIYELLPYTKKIDVKDELVIYDHEASKTKRVRVESLITDNDFDFPWDSEVTYAKDSIVSFGGDLWESLQSSNLGNMPVESGWWTRLNKVVGSTVVEYQPGVYGKGLVIVHYPYEGSIAAYAGVKLWELVVPEAQRPFHSTNIIAEIEAEEGGNPAPKWAPVHPVGGGDPGDLTAFVAKNSAGTDIVLTPSDASRWGSILSEGKATLIAFLDYIGSRLGQIGDRDVDASSRQDGKFLKYDAMSGKYVHEEVEGGDSTAFNGNRQITTIPAVGEIPGGDSMGEVLENMFFGAVAPGATLALVGDTVREFTGSSNVNYTLNWSVTKKTNPVASINVAGQVVAPSGGDQSGSTTVARSSNVNVTLSITASDGSKQTTKSVSVSYKHGIYCGALANVSAVSDADILSLGNIELRNDRFKTYTLDSNGKHTVIAFPVSWGTPSFIVNGLPNTAYIKVRESAFINAGGYSEPYQVWASNTIQYGVTLLEIK